MTRIILCILLLGMAAQAVAADKVGITITGPSQQLTVTTQSQVITPNTVTVNAQIQQIGTETLMIAVPGPQGISGTGGGVTVHNNLTGRDAADAHPSSAITGLDAALAGKTDTTDPRLTDARTPLPHSQGADTITGLADVATSGSYADLSNTPEIPAPQVNSDWLAENGMARILNKPTIPSQSSQIAYAAGTVQDALDELFYVPISITSYTLDGGGSITRELGSSYTITAGLEWATNKAAISQTVNSVARTSPYIPAPSTVSTNQTYTLQVGDGQTTASSSRTVTFTHNRYWGVSAEPTLDDAGVVALAGKEFSTSRAQSRTFTPAAEYIYVAYLATAGAALFTVNGFLDDSWVLVQRQFVNASGYSAEFRIYRSANRLTGTFSVVVT